MLDDPNAPESGEGCFQPLTLGDGSPKYVLPNTEEIHDLQEVYTTVKLPDGFTCERCVLRWTYTAGRTQLKIFIKKLNRRITC